MSERQEVSSNFDLAAEELEKAAAHCRVASKRFTANDVPAGCAHAFASNGHIAKAMELLDKNSIIHSNFAQIDE